LHDHDIAGAGGPAPAIHYVSHDSLLSRRRRSAGAQGLDAIVVSAARPARHLRPALELGAALGTPVVVMCSHDVSRQTATAWAARVPGADCVPLDLPATTLSDRLEFRTSAFHEALIGSHGNLSAKRNFGLALGRLAGWRRVLFLDDDIAGLDPSMVRRAGGALADHVAVGMPALDFPDNSVVCHAHRLGGGEQGVFVSGSALAVDVCEADSFFPDTYNEDWFFLAPQLDRRKVATVGAVIQQEYDPFWSPHRAAAQEFGDVLAEGLIGFLHSARLQPPPPLQYWEAFLRTRADFLSGVLRRCRSVAARNAVAAVELAQEALSRLSAALLAKYVQAWLLDLATWRRYLLGLPNLGDPVASIEYLGLRPGPNPRLNVPAAWQHLDPAPSRRLCAE
jgi:hypothetical protein